MQFIFQTVLYLVNLIQIYDALQSEFPALPLPNLYLTVVYRSGHVCLPWLYVA